VGNEFKPQHKKWGREGRKEEGRKKEGRKEGKDIFTQ
jgi:hypothetical protein